MNHKEVKMFLIFLNTGMSGLYLSNLFNPGRDVNNRGLELYGFVVYFCKH